MKLDEFKNVIRVLQKYKKDKDIEIDVYDNFLSFVPWDVDVKEEDKKELKKLGFDAFHGEYRKTFDE